MNDEYIDDRLCKLERASGTDFQLIEMLIRRLEDAEKRIAELESTVANQKQVISYCKNCMAYEAPEVKDNLKTLFDLIDQERFEDARVAITALECKLGDGDSELTRARSLIHFLKDA